ncbi:MAG: hypothetical protein GX869_07490 [Candidatus Cloacimonetes bacterium]|nr:hypothetical protein [Candidatus Cloacimonadota bacterium]
MKNCKICNKPLKPGQNRYCSNKCRLKGLNEFRKSNLKLNQELIKKVCGYIKTGNYIETSCRACGITAKTYYEWIKKAEIKPNSIYGMFSKAIEEAEAEAEIALELEIRKKVPEDWRAGDTILKKRFRKRWGDKIEYEGGMAVTVDVGDKVKKLLQDPKQYKTISEFVLELGGEEFFTEEDSTDKS